MGGHAIQFQAFYDASFGEMWPGTNQYGGGNTLIIPSPLYLHAWEAAWLGGRTPTMRSTRGVTYLPCAKLYK